MISCLGDVWEKVVWLHGLLVVGWSCMMVVAIRAEGCVGELRHVMLVSACCSTHAMLWQECECTWSVGNPWNEATPEPNLKSGSG